VCHHGGEVAPARDECRCSRRTLALQSLLASVLCPRQVPASVSCPLRSPQQAQLSVARLLHVSRLRRGSCHDKRHPRRVPPIGECRHDFPAGVGSTQPRRPGQAGWTDPPRARQRLAMSRRARLMSHPVRLPGRVPRLPWPRWETIQTSPPAAAPPPPCCLIRPCADRAAPPPIARRPPHPPPRPRSARTGRRPRRLRLSAGRHRAAGRRAPLRAPQCGDPACQRTRCDRQWRTPARPSPLRLRSRPSRCAP